MKECNILYQTTQGFLYVCCVCFFFPPDEHGMDFSFLDSAECAVVLLSLIAKKSQMHACESREIQVSSFCMFSV